MPVSLKHLHETKGMVFLHLCEVCQADAPFGVGVNIRVAMKCLAAGNKVGAKRHLGAWYCGEHRPRAGDASA